MTQRTQNEVAEALDQTLTDLISLGVAAKQAHWNVVGPGFAGLHLLLDELAELARSGSDRVAERSAALGRSPDGRLETVAKKDPLPPLADPPLQDTDVVALFGDIISIVCTRLFTSIDVTAIDPVTQGILVDVTEKLDKVAWMIRAHGHPTPAPDGGGTTRP